MQTYFIDGQRDFPHSGDCEQALAVRNFKRADMHKELLAVAGGVAFVVLLRNMIGRTVNPLLAALKVTWPT